MAEADFYQPIKERLEELFRNRGRQPYLEITATKGLSEKLKQKIPQNREIVFVFLKKDQIYLVSLRGNTQAI